MILQYDRDNLLDQFGIRTLRDRYMLPTEQSPQDNFGRAAAAYADDAAHGQRMYDYMSKLWFMPSTPILANGGTGRAQPISCFLMDVDDSREGLADHFRENLWLSSEGGGVAANWSNVRPLGSRTAKGNVVDGIVPHLTVMNAATAATNQGDTRKSSYAAYLNDCHPEIEEFINIRKPTGGDPARKCISVGFHHAVNVQDAFMHLVEGRMLDPNFDDRWPLINPKSGEVTGHVSAKDLWIQMLETRVQTGEPYLHFIDTSNRYLPEWLKAKGLRVKSSNLCTEILLPSAPDRTAVCCLSSVNAARSREWLGNHQFIEDILRYLDNVLTEYIRNAPKDHWKSVGSAKVERSVGLGCMGFHTMLQQDRIPFESALAVSANLRLFKFLRDACHAANIKLGKERGECADAEGYGVRFSHTMAIAPNASSSIICGNISPSCDALNSNAFLQKTLSGTNVHVTRELGATLTRYGKNTPEVWKQIKMEEGSVQNLDWMDQYDRDVHKTAWEMDQRWVIDHAADRTPLVDQGQSVNIYLPPNVDANTLHHVHFRAWKKGLKTLYYLRSDHQNKVSGQTFKIADKDVRNFESCLACEG